VQPFFQWKINNYYIFWECFRCPACNAHAPYCHLWSIWLYNILAHYLTKGTIFGGKKSYWTYICFDFLYDLTSVWNIYHSKKNWERYDQKCTLLFMQSVSYSCQFLIKLDSFRHIFEKYLFTKFHENPYSRSRVFPCGRTDRHDETNCHFSEFCKKNIKMTTKSWIHTFHGEFCIEELIQEEKFA